MCRIALSISFLGVNGGWNWGCTVQKQFTGEFTLGALIISGLE